MSIKILHFADLHLGRGFSDYGEASEALCKARYETLDKLITTANDQDCDAVVIAGDLFDRTSMNKADVVRATQSLNKFENGAVLLLPGNHDYITADSKLWRYVSEAKDEHVIILKNTKPYDLSGYDINGIVYPGPCHSKHSNENQISWIQHLEKDKSKINIGVAHGSVPEAAIDLKDEHFPMTQKELNDAGLDLWLLGHIHVPWPDNPGGNDAILYSGTPEPDTANCPHEGTALIIEIDDNKSVTIEKLTTGKYRFERWTHEVSSLEDLEALVDKAERKENSTCVCRLTLQGVLDPEDYNQWIQTIFPDLKQSFLYLRINDEALKKRITKGQLYEMYPEESFPVQLLSGFIEEDDQEALQTAYDLLEEVKDEN